MVQQELTLEANVLLHKEIVLTTLVGLFITCTAYMHVVHHILGLAREQAAAVGLHNAESLNLLMQLLCLHKTTPAAG